MSGTAAVAPQLLTAGTTRLNNSNNSNSDSNTRPDNSASSNSRPRLLWQSLKKFLLPRSLQSIRIRTRNDRGSDAHGQQLQQQQEDMHRRTTRPKVPERLNSASAASKPQLYVVGSPSPTSPFLRIAHIGDTCSLADSGSGFIYQADVIVHSGNLCSGRLRRRLFNREAEFLSQLKAIDGFFAALPHRYKIFVPGPHEAAFLDCDDSDRIQALLPNCIYLRDSGCTIEGVHFHGVARGSPTGRFGRLAASADAREAWRRVPDTVDVLISHSLPTNSIYEDLVTRLKPKLLLYSCRLNRSSRSADQSSLSFSSSGSSSSTAAASASSSCVNCVKFKDSIIFANGHAGNGLDCRRGVFDFYAAADANVNVEMPATVAAAGRR